MNIERLQIGSVVQDYSGKRWEVVMLDLDNNLVTTREYGGETSMVFAPRWIELDGDREPKAKVLWACHPLGSGPAEVAEAVTRACAQLASRGCVWMTVHSIEDNLITIKGLRD